MMALRANHGAFEKRGRTETEKVKNPPPKKKTSSKAYIFRFHGFFSGTKFLLSPFSLGSPVAKNPHLGTRTIRAQFQSPGSKSFEKDRFPQGRIKMGFVVKHHTGFLADRNGNHKTAVSYLTGKLLLLQLQQKALGPSKFKIET